MKLDLFSNKNDEFYTPAYAIEPILKYIPKNSTIWCPFDTEESLYVQIFKDRSHNVIATHISNNQDFFTLDIQCDFIISNPPYSLKSEVFEHLFSLKKPFAMLVGVVGIFESKKRFNLFENNSFEIMYLNKRVSYFENYQDVKPLKNPPFSSVYLTSNMLPEKIIFEKINKHNITRNSIKQHKFIFN